MSKTCTVPRGPNAGYSHSKLKYLEEKQESNMDCFSSGCFFFFLARWQESVAVHFTLQTVHKVTDRVPYAKTCRV